MNGLSDFLFARPSLTEGMSRVLDLGDTLTEYNRSPSGEQADYYALFADWRAVGQDIIDATHQYQKKALGARPGEQIKAQKATAAR